MGIRIALTLLVLSTLAIVPSVQAELLLYEPFDYDVGPLDGNDGGIGFGEPWLADPEFLQVDVPANPLSYAVPGGGPINGGARALRFLNDTPDTLANNTELAIRGLESEIDGDDIYFSFLYRYAGGFVDDNDFVIWWFNDTGGPNIGLKGNLGNGSGIEDFMARMMCCGPPHQEYALDWDVSDEAGTIGADFFLVGRLHRAGNSDDPDDYDQYDLWVNPAAADKDNPQSSGVALPDDVFLTEVFALGMRAFSQEPDDEMWWDELRIGTTWEDVISGMGEPFLRAGDADEDFDFDQIDLVQVQIAAKYLTGQAAVWGEGDWDGAPGGSQGNPPAGDGQFNQLDIIAALSSGVYLTGPYAALSPNGQRGDGQTSIGYDPSTGEVFVDAPAGTDLTSVNIDSAAGIFTGDAAQNLGGSFDNDADSNIFKATFGSSFGSLTFGNVAQRGLSQEMVLNDLTVVGSLAGGGDLGNVDLIYVPEPSTCMLLAIGLLGLVGMAHRRPL